MKEILEKIDLESPIDTSEVSETLQNIELEIPADAKGRIGPTGKPGIPGIPFGETLNETSAEWINTMPDKKDLVFNEDIIVDGKVEFKKGVSYISESSDHWLLRSESGDLLKVVVEEDINE